MLKIGLTGNIGCGKTIVARVFENLGIPVFRSDERAKDILDRPEITNRLKDLFGNIIIAKDTRIDRKKLASIVFQDKAKLEQLNKIVHPCVINDFEEWMNECSPAPYVLMESAILFETGFYKLFDKIIIVTAPETVRIERVMKRDSISEEEVRIRIANQISDEKNFKRADFVIANDNDQLVIPQVLKIHKILSLL